MNKKIYLIGIGGIGVSAVARYYLENNYKVFGSDSNNSELIEKLKEEGIDIIIGTDENRIDSSFEKVIYSEAISRNHKEILKAKKLNIRTLSYPEALSEIANSKKLIAISGTHGKSTTTSLLSIILKNSKENFSSVVGTLLKEFNGKNFFHRNNKENENKYFILEACEYKRSFLKYKPFIGVVLNIDLDHLDYYKDLDDYVLAFEEFLNNIVKGGFAIINGEDKNCKKLFRKRKDINYIEVYKKYAVFTNLKGESEIINFPEINLKIPGEHILFDAKIAYIVTHMIGIKDEIILKSLKEYNGVWRRMEKIGETENENILMSDYGHHPTEIKLTLKGLKDQNPARPILCVFQPHKYSRTLELLEDFKTCFYDTDTLIIPNIYESRDYEEDKKKINSKILIDKIDHFDKIDGENIEKTLDFINNWDSNNSFGIILLMGAGDIDNLRYKIKTKT